MPGFTQELASFLTGLATTDVPEAEAATIRRGLTDLVGVILAGSEHSAVRAARAARGSSSGHAHLIPDGGMVAPEDAALINGIAGHALDYDDTGLDGHPSAVLGPALLARGEALDASADAVLRAYRVGYEAWGALWRHAPVPLHGRGWHPSSVFGAVAAAAACIALRRPDALCMRNAIGLGAAEAAGLVANFGTMAKPYQVGRAARAGLIAADLAEAGMDAAPDILEHSKGFFGSFAGGMRSEIQLGGTLAQEGISIKLYPVCYAAHRIVDAALELQSTAAIPPDDIDRIHVRIGATQLGMLRNHRPATTLEAKFSAQYAVVAPLLFGRLSNRELAPDRVASAAAQSLMARVTLEPVEERLPGQPFSPYDQVTLTSKTVRSIASSHVVDASGCHARPPSEDTLWAKFRDNAMVRLSEDEARRAFRAFADLGGSQPVSAAMQTLLLSTCSGRH